MTATAACDEPEEEDERGDAAFRRVLEVEVVKINVGAGGQGTRFVGGDEVEELRVLVDLLGADAEPGMPIDDFPAGTAAAYAELVGIQIAGGFPRALEALADAEGIEGEEEDEGQGCEKEQPGLPIPNQVGATECGAHPHGTGVAEDERDSDEAAAAASQGVQRSRAEKRRRAVTSRSTIICSPERVIRWLVKPVMRLMV
jgi:hypothetical protein